MVGVKAPVAKPLHCAARVERSGAELLVRWRPLGWVIGGAVVFLWLIGWTVGCVQLTTQALEHPTAYSILVAAVFWTFWLLAAGAAFWTTFGSESLRIGPDGAEYHCQAVVEFSRRRLPLDEVRRVGDDTHVSRDESGRVEVQHAVTLETSGRPIVFARGIEDQERLWLAGLIQQHLQALLPDRPIPMALDERPEEAPFFEVLKPKGLPTPSPADSRIRLQPDRDGVIFSWQCRFSAAALLGMTVLVVFWNGIVGIFVRQLVQHFKWDLFFFLFPFVVIGVVLLAAWCGVLLAPVWKQTWRANPAGLSTRRSLLGVGRNRLLEAWQVDRIEVRRRGRTRCVEGATPDPPDGQRFLVAVVGREEADRLVIKRLTEDEARWIGGEFRRILPEVARPGSLAPGEPQTLWDPDLDAQPAR